MIAAPRGPANYLAEIFKRTLAKLSIETDLAFNLEYNHSGSTENHPLHIHGAFCIPDDRVGELQSSQKGAGAGLQTTLHERCRSHRKAP